MAKKKNKRESKYQGLPRTLPDGRQTEPTYYLRNPAGAVHMVTREHAMARLQDARYELATDAEIERMLEAKTQVWEDPVGEPWEPIPDVLANVPDPVEADPLPPMTKRAEEIALDAGLTKKQLSEIEPTGAEDQILTSDVRGYLDDQGINQPE